MTSSCDIFCLKLDASYVKVGYTDANAGWLLLSVSEWIIGPQGFLSDAGKTSAIGVKTF